MCLGDCEERQHDGRVDRAADRARERGDVRRRVVRIDRP